MKQIDGTGNKTLVVIDEKKRLLGTLTDGDIRRFILKGNKLTTSISEIYNKNSIFLKKCDNLLVHAQEMMIKNVITLLPVVDEDLVVVECIDWYQVILNPDVVIPLASVIDVPVIIMAGGKGTRLEPFTKILPKPLVPIGDTTIVETIIKEFKKYGMHAFFMTLNYRGEMIEAYFSSVEKNYELNFLWEKEYLGTAGSLKLIENQSFNTFIVSNCDVVVKADYREVLEFHKQSNASLTMISSYLNHTIPYGVVEFKQGGEVTTIKEKPEINFTINTGIYILERECLQYIPENTVVDMPTLIDSLMKNGKKVYTYPVNESDYIDIGQWEEYKKAVDKLSILK